MESVPEKLLDLAARFDMGVSRPLVWRRKQLQGLYDIIQTESSVLTDAVLRDTQCSKVDLLVEMNAVLVCIQQCIDKVSREAKEGQKTKSGETHNPVGVVLISPDHTSFLASSMIPMALAFAAGNVVALTSRARPVDDVMKLSLSSYLDQMGYAILDVPKRSAGSPLDDIIASPSVSVLATHGGEPISVSGTLQPSTTPSAVYVNNSAFGLRWKDTPFKTRRQVAQSIARLVVRGVLILGGRVAHTPRLVLVDDEVSDEFINALSDVSSELARGNGRLSIVEVDLASSAPHVFKDGPAVYVAKVPSPDAALDRLQTLSRLSVAYIFSREPFTSYITSNIESDVTLVNDIPTSFLVNPYSADMSALESMLARPQKISCFSAPASAAPVIPSESELLSSIKASQIERLDEGSGISTDFFGHVKMVFNAVKYTTYAGIVLTGYMMYNRYQK